MNEYAKYLTGDKFSTLLINNINYQHPKNIIDLGTGEGSLLNAALAKWEYANYSAVDIRDSLSNLHENVTFIRHDLIRNFKTIESILSNLKFDVAICNPPYLKIEKKQNYFDVLKKARFYNSLNLGTISADLVFLCYNLFLLRKNGVLGIIVPDTLIASHNFRYFREDILKYEIEHVIELKEKIFSRTEAKTYILIIKNKLVNHSNKVRISQSTRDGQIESSIWVNRSDLVNRMDYSFFSSKRLQSGVKLKEIGVQIVRGKHSKKQLADLGAQFYHLNNFKEGQFVSFSKRKLNLDKNYASNGDILVARVGSRCVGKFSIVTDGHSLISDCIFRIRISEKYRKPLLNSFNSKNYQTWVQKYSHGVCSKLISKVDLLNYEIPFKYLESTK